MLPYFFRHYDPLVDRYFVYDHDSSDGSFEMLARHPRVTLGRFEVFGDSFVAAARHFYETAWHSSRGKADWVILVNIDEHLHHPEGRDYLVRCGERGVTVVTAEGYEMVAERFPVRPAPLRRLIRHGARAPRFDKLCVFRPDAVTRIGYAVGRHSAAPEGHVVEPATAELKLLHYKHLGLDYVLARTAELRTGLRARDLAQGWGVHYLLGREAITAKFAALAARAAPVPGL